MTRSSATAAAGDIGQLHLALGQRGHARLQGAERLPDLEIVEVDSVVSEALSRHKVAADNADIAITTDAPTGFRVHGDQALLVTALANLISNAMKFTPAGSVAVGVNAGPLADGRRGAATPRRRRARAATGPPSWCRARRSAEPDRRLRARSPGPPHLGAPLSCDANHRLGRHPDVVNG